MNSENMALPIQYIKIISSPIKLPVLQEVTLDSSGIISETHQISGINQITSIIPIEKVQFEVQPVSLEIVNDVNVETLETSSSNVEAIQQQQSQLHQPQQQQPSTTGNEINCLFCYKRESFDVDKVWKGVRILRKTSQRLLEFIGKYLNIEIPPHGQRLKDSVPKGRKLLPHNLPLCEDCSVVYYQRLYDTFVQYENAVAKLHTQIGSCITKAIALSARDNEKSIDKGVLEIQDHVNMISREYENINEHEVMKEVRRFRAQVLEKNPGGYKDPEEMPKVLPKAKAKVVSPGKDKTGRDVAVPVLPSASNSPSAASSVPSNLNIIKIVKKKELGPDKFEHLSGQLLNNVQGSGNEDVIEIPKSCDSPKILNSYAVSNPSPGVIQIIPMNVVDDSDWQRRRVKQARLEPEYAEQRRRIYTCKFCNKYFPGQAKLNMHQVKVHRAEKPVQCEKCDHRFIDQASLKAHMITHLDQSEKEKYKKYVCHLCPVKYRTKRNLDIHLRRHTGEKPYECSVCQKKFTSKMSMTLCVDKHNGVKNHKCPYCDQNFLRREVLKIHIRQHTGDRPFECGVCGKTFAQRSPLRIHLRYHEKLGSNYVPRPSKNSRKNVDS